MKKRIISIIVIIIITSIFYLFYNNENKIIVNTDDSSFIIPKKISDNISDEMLSKSKMILSIIDDDPKNGYSIGLATPSLSKQGVKKIYDFLKKENACIDDEQGYFDLENQKTFDDFWDQYSHKEKCSFKYYTITQTGDIKRADYHYENNMFYVIYSYLNLSDHNNPTIDYIYGNQIEDAKYDDIGFFYYKTIVDRYMKRFGVIEYEYVRIKPLGDKNREYTQKYISTIDYECTNIFTEEWDLTNIDKINFSDLFENLYELKYQKAFYANEMNYSVEDPFVKDIPEDYFEELVQQYFPITKNQLKKQKEYNKERKVYLWSEAYCIPSKFETPSIHPEVINISEKKNLIILTVRANAYEYGYSQGFLHKIYIRKKDNSFQYIGNKIIESENNYIPKYNPGVSCSSTK